MKNNLEIGNRIRSIREGLHLNRDLFSEKINISESFLSQIERGEKSLSLNTLISICETTGYTADYILFGDVNDNLTCKKVMRIIDKLSPDGAELVYEIVRSINSYGKKI